MDLALGPEDAELASTLDTVLAKESSSARVRAAESLGFDPELWRTLVGLGVPGAACGADAASTEQLSLIADQAGRHLASAPVVESLVTARLLSAAGARAALLEQAEAGAIVTLTLHRLPGTAARLVPAGAVADVVVRYDGSRLTAVQAPAPGVATPNLGSQPLADRDLAGGDVIELADGERARGLFESAQRDWLLLTAAQLVGLGARALEIGVDYVRDRQIFGQSVGAFQTVAHRLADNATNMDGARLLVQEAAWAVDVGDPRARALASMAFCFAAETALAVASDSLHFHGGYGFSLEYDIQLFYRRARAYPLVWGSVQQEYQRLADELYGALDHEVAQ